MIAAAFAGLPWLQATRRARLSARAFAVTAGDRAGRRRVPCPMEPAMPDPTEPQPQPRGFIGSGAVFMNYTKTVPAPWWRRLLHWLNLPGGALTVEVHDEEAEARARWEAGQAARNAAYKAMLAEALARTMSPAARAATPDLAVPGDLRSFRPRDAGALADAMAIPAPTPHPRQPPPMPFPPMPAKDMPSRWPARRMPEPKPEPLDD